MISKKIILTGSFGVGKTSLFNQFMYSEFSDKYLTTIGVKVNSKIIHTSEGDITLYVWDIAGEISQDKIPMSYFLGAAGIVYVLDATRPNNEVNVSADLHFLKRILPQCKITIVANKKDLLTPEALARLSSETPIEWDYLTSAKTGENVEILFTDLAEYFMEQAVVSVSGVRYRESALLFH